jgi:hypothetical protein
MFVAGFCICALIVLCGVAALIYTSDEHEPNHPNDGDEW